MKTFLIEYFLDFIEKMIGDDELSDEGIEIDSTEDERQEIARSSHAGMLHDHQRHLKYNLALEKAIQEKSEDGLIQVLDIGTGTGILSMIAAKLSDKLQITACEMFTPVANLAEDIIKDNGYQKRIAVVNKASTSLEVPQDMPRKADILVTEILDSELIGEGVIPTINDAHRRLLSSNVKTIPAAAEVYVQLIESHTLFNTNKLSGFNLPRTFQNCQGTANAHELQCSQIYPDHIKLLSEPHKCAELDFSKPYIHNRSRKESSHQKIVSVTQSGKLHAVVMWWNLILHKGGNVTLNMAPSWCQGDLSDGFDWRDHWMQCVYYIPNEIDIQTDDFISVTMHHDDFSVWFDVVPYSTGKLPPSLLMTQRPMCDCGLHVSWSRETFTLWNSEDVIKKWRTICKDLSQREKQVTIIGESSLLPLVMKQTGCDTVAYMECSQWSKTIISKISQFNNFEINFVESVQKDTVVIIDPFWSSNILPWQVLRIWPLFQESEFSACNVVSPIKLHLKAVVVKFAELWRVRSPVSKIFDINLSKFDDLISDVQCVHKDEQVRKFYQAEPYAMVEYEHSMSSDIISLRTFDLSDINQKEEQEGSLCGNPQTTSIKLQQELTKEMGLVVWMDYQMSEEVTFTTGLKQPQPTTSCSWVGHSKQGLVFIPSEISNKLKGNSTLDVTLLYRHGKDNDIIFTFS